MLRNLSKADSYTGRASTNTRIGWTLVLAAALLGIYALGGIAWPAGPLFILRLLLRPLALLILLWLGAFGLGDLLLEMIGLRPEQNERPLFAAGVGLIVWWLAILGAGLLGLLQGSLAITLLLGLALFGLWRWSLLLASLRLGRSFPGWWPLSLFVLVLAAALYPLFAHGLMPPLRWDEIAYHLAIPKLYVNAGRIIYIPFIVHSNWPFGTEMLYTLALLLGPDGEVLAHLIQWSLALLTAAGLWSIGQRHGKGTGLLAAAIFLSIPVVQEIAGSGLIDVGLGAFSWLAFMAWWRWKHEQTWPWLLLTGVLAGGAASLKLTGAAVAMILAAFTIVASGRPWLRERVAAAAVVGLVALAVVSPWYLKSWVYTGDPIWPFGIGIFPTRHWDALGDRYHYDYLRATNMPRTVQAFLTGPIHLIRRPADFGGFSLGSILPWLVPLGLLCVRRNSLARWLLLFLGAFYSTWFLLTHQIRFLMPALPMAALSGALGATWLIARLGGPARVAVLALLVWGLPLLHPAPRATLLGRLPYLTGQQTRDELLRAAIRPYPVFEYINRSLPADARVLLATYENRAYYLDREYVWANPISQRYLRFEQIPDGTALRRLLAAHQIEYLLDNRQEWPETLTGIEHYDHLLRILDELIAAHGEPLVSERGITLYRLRPVD